MIFFYNKIGNNSIDIMLNISYLSFHKCRVCKMKAFAMCKPNNYIYKCYGSVGSCGSIQVMCEKCFIQGIISNCNIIRVKANIIAKCEYCKSKYTLSI